MQNMVASLTTSHPQTALARRDPSQGGWTRRANLYPARVIALAGRPSDVLVVLDKDRVAIGSGMLCDFATGSRLAPVTGPNPVRRWARDGNDSIKIWIDAAAWSGVGETLILMRWETTRGWYALEARRLG